MLKCKFAIHSGWINATSVSLAPLNSVNLVKIGPNEAGDYQIRFSIRINEDRTWVVSIMGSTQELPIFAEQSKTITTIADLKAIVNSINQSTLCCGNNDGKYEELISSKKGIFMDQSGKLHVPKF